jgi:hypothetical protein
MKASVSFVKVGDCPSVIIWAIPRPAIIKISVATMGCMSKYATRMPFQRPHNAPTPIAMRMTKPGV